MKRLLIAMIALGTLGLAAFVPSANAATDVQWTDDNVTNVKVAGSDTTYFMLAELGKIYNESDGCQLNNVSIKPVAPSPTVPVHNQCKGATTPEGVRDPVGQSGVVTTENYDHDVIINYFPQGSTAGRTQLCAQLPVTDPNRLPGLLYVDLARSSSTPATSFQCTVNNGAPTAAGQRRLRFIGFARDALTWVKWTTVTGASTGVTNLTVGQLKDIFVDCNITNWSQVGGGNAPIAVYTAIPGSGTRPSWDSFVGGNSDNCIPAQFKDGTFANGERVIREHQAAPVEDALNDPAAADEGNSIFPFGVATHNTCAGCRQSSLLGNINGIAPDAASISTGTFPFSRLMYNVIIQAGPSPTASEATRRFTNMRTWSGPQDNELLGWLCKPANAHAKPLDDTVNPGIPTPNANKAWAKELQDGMARTGFFPLTTDPTQPRCTFADYIVNTSSMDLAP